MNLETRTTTPQRRLKTLFGVVTVQAVLIAALAVASFILYSKLPKHRAVDSAILQMVEEGRNVVAESYPHVDFQRIYPTLTPDEIDGVQRESYSIRYVYAPYIQFRAFPKKTRFVEISPIGYRKGNSLPPWPPDDNAFNVFVFGGSTIFGYGLPDGMTVPAQLEVELQSKYPDRQIAVYNFGSGYYFSQQERTLLEYFLVNGFVPNAAVFINGMNDFYYPYGVPEYTADFYRHSAQGLPPLGYPPIENDHHRHAAVSALLARYADNAKILEALSERFELPILQIGQPVPFYQCDTTNLNVYPFYTAGSLAPENLCAWGYNQFHRAATEGAFGKTFHWLGDCFIAETEPMYSDGAHYSPKAAALLGAKVAELLGPAIESD